MDLKNTNNTENTDGKYFPMQPTEIQISGKSPINETNFKNFLQQKRK